MVAEELFVVEEMPLGSSQSISLNHWMDFILLKIDLNTFGNGNTITFTGRLLHYVTVLLVINFPGCILIHLLAFIDQLPWLMTVIVPYSLDSVKYLHISLFLFSTSPEFCMTISVKLSCISDYPSFLICICKLFSSLPFWWLLKLN